MTYGNPVLFRFKNLHIQRPNLECFTCQVLYLEAILITETKPTFKKQNTFLVQKYKNL